MREFLRTVGVFSLAVCSVFTWRALWNPQSPEWGMRVLVAGLTFGIAQFCAAVVEDYQGRPR